MSLSQPHTNSLSEGETTGTMIRTVGKCRVLAELGHGGMANVYLAVQRGQGGFNKLVVLKALRPELAVEPTLSMFLDEARVAAQLNHANVVQTYEVGTHNDRHVIVMEYLEGQAFSQVLRQAKAQGKELALGLKLRVIINALEGLHYAHELTSYDGTLLRLVHRDVSPQNIFVTYTGHVKVLDFGIAKAATSTTETAAGVVKGKLSYMAPEQLSGDHLDRRADVFSVGCILWSFATGQRLWQDLSDVQVMRKLWDGEIPSPLSVNPGCDAEFARIIERAMSFDPSQRYETALDLQADLEKYLDTLGKSVNQKELGAAVTELFRASREELKQLIELQLKRIDSGEDSSVGVPIIGIPDVNPSASQMQQGEPGRGRAWLPLAVVLTAGLLIASFFFGANQFAPAREPTVVRAPPAEPKQVAPPDPTPEEAMPLATVRLQVEPAGANVYFDELQLPVGTRSKVIPADNSVHVVRAEAEGYRTASLEFAASGDKTIELVLEREAPASSRARPVAVRRAPKPKSSATTEPSETKTSGPNCSNPFYIDAAGIKRVRAECR